MITDHQFADLLNLVRQRYPDWENVQHPSFVADEIANKRNAAEQAAQLLGAGELARLEAIWDTVELFKRIARLARATNLLWNRVPRHGDLALLNAPGLGQKEFALQFRNLLYAEQSLPDRLDSFSRYCLAHHLPNKWALPTYFLFLIEPDNALFLRPAAMRWFLKYVGRGDAYTPQPSGYAYRTLLEAAGAVRRHLTAYGAVDMIDVQGFLWVAAREGQLRTGGLTPEGQIALEVPAETDLRDEPAYIREAALARGVAEPLPQYDVDHPNLPEYPLASVAEHTGYELSQLAFWIEAIVRKGQAIFYGPPGSGKTFLAGHLARHLAGGGDGFVEQIQFHPGYAYEEFIQGIRPVADANGDLRYALQPGRFLQVAAQASGRRDRCVLIIDEINRADLVRVFGELLYLLEYRDEEIPLAAGNSLSIPTNLLIVGTMNTADRSIALVDYALRRRFAFLTVRPDYSLLRRFHAAAETAIDIDRLIELLEQINETLQDEERALGVSYFMAPLTPDRLRSVWQTEIEPYLQEQFFDQPGLVASFRWSEVRALLIKR